MSDQRSNMNTEADFESEDSSTTDRGSGSSGGYTASFEKSGSDAAGGSITNAFGGSTGSHGTPSTGGASYGEGANEEGRRSDTDDPTNTTGRDSGTGSEGGL